MNGFDKFWSAIEHEYASIRSVARYIAKRSYEAGYAEAIQGGEGFKAEVQIQWRKREDYGDLFEIVEFTDAVRHTAFTDDDGTGYYATETLVSNVYARPSDIYVGNIDKTQPWTHIMWFNK